MDNLIGRQLGSYRLTKELGAGAFGTVYLGEHMHLPRRAAIKVLHGKRTKEEVEDFRREARTISNLNHPHIVQVVDFGTDASLNIEFLVLAYASGGTLRQHHPLGTPLPMPTVIEYTKQIASALQYAHGQKIIHRDVKPANILLGSNGELLLSDFGTMAIAHSTSSMVGQGAAGTPIYMAPEQIMGKPVRESDQYALGVLVYEWLTGSVPFQGATIMEIATQHLHAKPSPPSSRLSSLPLALDSVVLRALAKDPHDRFSSVEEFAKQLEQVGASAQVSKEPDPEQTQKITSQNGVEGKDALERESAAIATPPARATLPLVRWYEQMYLTIFQLVNNVHWGVILALAIPSQIAFILRVTGSHTDKAAVVPLVTVPGIFIAAALNPLVGAISDKWRHKLGRRRPFLIYGLIPNIIGLAIMALAPSVPALIIGFIVIQFANNLCGSAWSAIIADRVPKNQLGSASGWYGLMTLLGTVGGFELGGILNSAADPNTYHAQLLLVYGVVAGLQALGVGLSVLLVKETPLESAPKFSSSEFFTEFVSTVRNYPNFRWILITRFLVQQGIWAIYFFLQYYFRDVIKSGHPEASATNFLVLVMIAAVITTYTSGQLADRIGMKPMVYLSGAMMAIVCFLFIFFQTQTGANLAAIFFGLGYGAYTSVDYGLATAVLPPTDQAGKDMGIWSVAGIAPQAVGAAIGGIVLTAMASSGAAIGVAYSSLFAVTCGLFILGTLLLYPVKGVR